MKTINICLILILVSNFSRAQKMDYVPFEYNTSKYESKIHKTLFIITPPLPESKIVTGRGRKTTNIAQYRKSIQDALIKVFSSDFDSIVFTDTLLTGKLTLKIGLIDPYWQSPFSYYRGQSQQGQPQFENPYCFTFQYQATLFSEDGKEISRGEGECESYLNTSSDDVTREDVVKAGFVSLLDAINEKVFMKPGVYELIK